MYNSVYNITEFGADPSGQLSSTQAINKAVETAHKEGGGVIVVPSGTFLTGAIVLMSNIELHLTPGAVLSFTNDTAEYPVIETRWEGVARKCYMPCIYAESAENIAITGRGTLEGNGKVWWDRQINGELEYPRPTFISPDRCKNLLIDGITILNSPSWTITPTECNIVNISNVQICNPADSPNTDGIDPESCRNVHISNCTIDVGDDCIAVKAGTEGTPQRIPCENITITNCTMLHGHGGVVLGSEMSGSIRNVTISNCVFDGTDRGIRIKTRRERGGAVEDMLVNNVMMRDVICPFVMNMYYFCGPRGKEPFVSDKNALPVNEGTPALRNIRLSNITARNVHAAAGFIYGLPESYIENIDVNNYTVEFAENAIPSKPAMMTGIEDMAYSGFYVGNTRGINFSNIRLFGHKGDAFIEQNVENITKENCRF